MIIIYFLPSKKSMTFSSSNHDIFFEKTTNIRVHMVLDKKIRLTKERSQVLSELRRHILWNDRS
jgi:hypothetical protein